MGKSAPKAPDYTAAAEATAESNQEALNMQTWANRMNQYNPWGQITYDTEQVIDPATGQRVTQWTQNQQLTPLAQEALDRQMAIDAQKSDFASQMMDRAGNTLLQDTDWSKFGGYGQAPTPYGMRAVEQPTAPPPNVGMDNDVVIPPRTDDNITPIRPPIMTDGRGSGFYDDPRAGGGGDVSIMPVEPPQFDPSLFEGTVTPYPMALDEQVPSYKNLDDILGRLRGGGRGDVGSMRYERLR